MTHSKRFQLIFFAMLLSSCTFDIGAAEKKIPLPKNADTPSSANTTPLKVERFDSAIDQIVPANAVMEKVVSGFTWVEGPVWINNDYFLFADIPSNSIRKWTPKSPATIFMQPSGYRGTMPYGGPEPGSNGMTIDVHGRLT